MKWRITRLLLIISGLWSLYGCAQVDDSWLNHSGATMGTTFMVKWAPAGHSQAENLPALITEALADINQSMSTYKQDSELSRFNRLAPATTIRISAGLAEVIELALKISAQTNGAFDPTVGPLVNLWGFGPGGLVDQPPTDQQIQQSMQLVGYQRIKLDQAGQRLTKMADVYVDLSAIAKGYAVDVIADLLVAKGIDNYLVEIGGDLRVGGDKPDRSQWRIGIDAPQKDAHSLQATIRIKDTAVATSGDYRNYFEQHGKRYSHTINPTTGKPITHRLAAVTVLMPTCAEADALATALMVMGADKGMEFAVKYKINAFFIVKQDDSFDSRWTPGFERFLMAF